MRVRTITLALTTFLLVGCQNVTKLDPWDLGREAWQRPADVITALAIQPGDSVADVGAGEGYFLPYLAEAVGDDGRVYAVEVAREIVEALAKSSEGDARIQVIQGRLDDPFLPEGEIDLVLLVNTYHHIEERRAYFERLRQDLSPAGRIALLEPNEELGGILSLFLEEGHTSRADEIGIEMREAGYERTERFDFLPVQIFEIYAPRRSSQTETQAPPPS